MILLIQSKTFNYLLYLDNRPIFIRKIHIKNETSSKLFQIDCINTVNLKKQLIILEQIIRNDPELFSTKTNTIVIFHLLVNIKCGFRSLGGRFLGSNFITFNKKISRPESDFDKIVDRIIEIVNFSEEIYNDDDYKFENDFYLNSIYLYPIGSSEKLIEKSIKKYNKMQNLEKRYMSTFNNSNLKYNYNIKKRTMSSWINSNELYDSTLKLEKFYNNIENSRDLEYNKIWDININISELTKLKFRCPKAYNYAVNCMKNPNIKFNFEQFNLKEESKHQLIKLNEIKRIVKNIQKLMCEPTKKDLKKFNDEYKLTDQFLLPIEKTKIIKGVKGEDIEKWYMLLKGKTLYFPSNNMFKNVFNLDDENNLYQFASNGYVSSLNIYLKNCRTRKQLKKSFIGLNLIEDCIYNDKQEKKFKNVEKMYEVTAKQLIKINTYATIVFDIETESKLDYEMKPYALGIKYGNNDVIRFYGNNCINDMLEYIWSHEWYCEDYRKELCDWLDSEEQHMTIDVNLKMLKEYIMKIKPNISNKIILVAHNAGSFDGQYILDYYKNTNTKDKVLPVMRGSKMIYITIKRDSKTIQVIDSMQHIKGSLAKIGADWSIPETKCYLPYKWADENKLQYIGEKPSFESFLPNSYNDEKIKEIREYWDKLPEKYNFLEHLNKYLNSDVIILHKIVDKYIRTMISINGINPMGSPSMPSYSTTVFKANHLRKHDIYTEIYYIENICRKAYYGGRTETFKPFLEKGYINDINSSYPFTMLKNKMPVGFGSKYIGIVTKDIFGFVYATVTYNGPGNIPILPIRANDGLCFTYGTFSGWWFSEELNYAEEYGYVVNRHEAILYDSTYNLFESFVNKFYNIKINSNNNTHIKVSKLMLNSLYGKLGSRDEFTYSHISGENLRGVVPKSTIKIFNEENTIDTYIEPGSIKQEEINKYLDNYFKNPKWYNSINPKFAKEISKCSRTNCVQLAAAITAYSRINLHKHLIIENLNPIYCDTDSIISENGLPERLINKELGGWDKKEVKNVYIPASKTYHYEEIKSDGSIKEKYAMKGFKPKIEIARFFKDMINGKISVINSIEYTFKINNVKLYPEMGNKRIKIVNNKRDNIYEKIKKIKIDNLIAIIDKDGKPNIKKEGTIFKEEIVTGSKPKDFINVKLNKDKTYNRLVSTLTNYE